MHITNTWNKFTLISWSCIPITLDNLVLGSRAGSRSIVTWPDFYSKPYISETTEHIPITLDYLVLGWRAGSRSIVTWTYFYRTSNHPWLTSTGITSRITVNRLVNRFLLETTENIPVTLDYLVLGWRAESRSSRELNRARTRGPCGVEEPTT